MATVQTTIEHNLLLLWAMVAFMLYAVARLRFRLSRTAWDWSLFQREAIMNRFWKVWLYGGGLLIAGYLCVKACARLWHFLDTVL